MKFISTLICVYFLYPLTMHAENPVQICEEKITIPTYGVAAPDVNPRFYTGRTYQGAQGRIYPYPISDVLTNIKEDKSYKAIYLENQYLKLCVLPEIGGRIFEAVDKSNEYHFFYRQHVIKPSLIGMLGAWISGGVEWNFPHHHRARTFMPMDYMIKDNDDGSKTLWLSELERRHRMFFMVGLTLFPDRAYVKATIRINNRTPYVHSILYFANPAVHVDSSYQVIFPPEAEYVTQHAKREFSEWPVSRSRYGGYSYDDIDISWWKNLPKPVSFFCWDHKSDYFAGYDHGRDAGVVYIGNRHLAPGKKFFTFGCGDEGKMWDMMLTDDDGPYLELMAGAWSDNQPDYSWIQPYEVKEIDQFWYPIKCMDGMTYANLNGAFNLSSRDTKIILSANSTKIFENAVVELKHHKKILHQEKINIAPDKPYHLELENSENVAFQEITVVLTSENGENLWNYTVLQKPGNPRPVAVKPPVQPAEIETIEELYLAGLRLDQFYNPQIDSDPYYREALRRDSCDYRVNTRMGINYLKRGMFVLAEQHLRTAVNRISGNYTRPKDGEALYYLGLTRQAQKKYDDAYDLFSRAVWSDAWRSAGYYALAEIDCINHNYQLALAHLDQALSNNSKHYHALHLKATLLRILGNFKEALIVLNSLETISPRSPWRLYELYRINQQNDQDIFNSIKNILSTDSQVALEVTADYINCGLFADALSFLKFAESIIPIEAIGQYYLAYLSEQVKNQKASAGYYQKARQASPNYVFPFRRETAEILAHAMNQNEKDWTAPLYLGNYLYDRQPEKAIEVWEIARQRNKDHPLINRNLGFAYAQTGRDLNKAIARYEEALKTSTKDARLYYEMDALYENAGIDYRKRLQLLENKRQTVSQRDDALSRLVQLYVVDGAYDKAITLLSEHHFNTWEGGGDIHTLFTDACQLQGLLYFDKKAYESALASFTCALSYPRNLEVGRPINDISASRIHYLIGLVHQQLGNPDQAKECFETCLQIDVGHTNFLYYQGKTWKALGDKDKGDILFTSLIENGRKRLRQEQDIDFFAKFGEKQAFDARNKSAYVSIAFGYLGREETETAKDYFRKAQALDRNDVWINYYLKVLP
jgi:tetratricopeptide (TPR) repeat protein